MSSLFKLPINYEDFKREYNPQNLDVIFREFQTIESSVENKGVTLNVLEDTYGLRDVLNFVETWLEFINTQLNINKPMDSKQIIFVSYKIVEKFSHFYLTDLKLIGDKILLGEGVRFYGSVDTQAILGAFNDYNKERKLKINERSNESVKHITEPTKTLRNYDSEYMSGILERMTSGPVKEIIERMQQGKKKEEKDEQKR